MSFSISIRQGPARLASQLPQLAKSSSTPATLRAFHQTATKNTFFTSRTAALRPSSTRPASGSGIMSRLAQASGRRSYYQQSQAVPDQASLTRKLIVGGAIFGGTLVGTNLFFNRETREDGGMPAFERAYLNQTFMHTGAGIGIIALTAQRMVRSGFIYRIMATNPWVVAIGGIALSYATMIGARSVDPDNYLPKYGLWAAFNATQAAIVAPMLAFVPGAVLARAGLYTVAMMGSIAFVGATAKQEKYLYIGGPLLAGGALVMASGLAPLVLPVTAVRTLAFTENIWLYGGLAVFGGFTLWDVQKVLHHARLAERGVIKRDPVNESIHLELDFLNIFIRMVQILMMQGNRRK